MSHRSRRNCTCCGKHDSEVGPISWRGNCASCGVTLLEENVRGIASKTGAAHLRRLRGTAEWLQKEYLDAQRSRP